LGSFINYRRRDAREVHYRRRRAIHYRQLRIKEVNRIKIHNRRLEYFETLNVVSQENNIAENAARRQYQVMKKSISNILGLLVFALLFALVSFAVYEGVYNSITAGNSHDAYIKSSAAKSGAGK